MAVAPITPTSITTAGIAALTAGATTGNTSGGHTFRNDGHQFIYVTNTNGSATSHTLTIDTPGKVGGHDVTQDTHPVAAGASLWIKVDDPSVVGKTVTLLPDHAELHLSVITV